MSAARRGVATEQMKLVAKDEDVTLDWLISKIAKGSTLAGTLLSDILYAVVDPRVRTRLEGEE
ncbi:MAG: hypothetical protein ACE1ZJ_03655, partial [Nitrospirales bacterium]